jgi:NTE family protein
MVIGKVLNAFLLDHVQSDYEVLTRVNRMIEDGESAYGTGFLGQVNKPVIDRGDLPYRRVQSLVVRPSEDIGRLAASYVRSGALRRAGGMTRRLLSILDVGEATEADLASYLLFDGAFAKKLIDLGRADAEARRHEIAEFFGSASDDSALRRRLRQEAHRPRPRRRRGPPPRDRRVLRERLRRQRPPLLRERRVDGASPGGLIVSRRSV